MSDPETMRSFTTLGAVVLGFLLGQTSEWFKSRRKASKQRRSVRRLIELETRNNISHINKFWDTIIKENEIWKSKDGSFLYVQLAYQASRAPFPPLATDAWLANLGEISSSYTESELEEMWNFQRVIERIHSLHAFFCEAQVERRNSRRHSHAMDGTAVMGVLVSGADFSESVREPAKEFKSLIEAVSEFEVISA